MTPRRALAPPRPPARAHPTTTPAPATAQQPGDPPRHHVGPRHARPHPYSPSAPCCVPAPALLPRWGLATVPSRASRAHPPRNSSSRVALCFSNKKSGMHGIRLTSAMARAVGALRASYVGAHHGNAPISLGAVRAAAARSTLAGQQSRPGGAAVPMRWLLPAAAQQAQLRGFSSPAESELSQLSDAVQRMLSLENASQVCV